MLEKVSQKFVWVSLLIVGYLFVSNFNYYLSDKWFYVNTVEMSSDHNFIPISLQEKIINYIANDAGSKSFSIARVGLLDYFGENFSLNYQYLLWAKGYKPDQSAKLKYTIYENTDNLPQNQKIVWIENIAVTKNEK